jgi:copper chaperone
MFELNVSGMGCGSCVARITRAVQSLDEAARVSVNRAEGKVQVETAESVEAVCQVIAGLGFPAAPAR